MFIEEGPIMLSLTLGIMALGLLLGLVMPRLVGHLGR
jgi:hypothetical protein